MNYANTLSETAEVKESEGEENEVGAGGEKKGEIVIGEVDDRRKRGRWKGVISFKD